MITRLHMPLPNVNMPCPLLFWLVIIVLFHCRGFSPAQYGLANPLVPPPIHAVVSVVLNVSRDNISLIITQCLGLPPMYSHPTIPLSVHFALDLFYRAQKPSSFTLRSKHTNRPVLIAFSCTLTLLLLCSSGDVEVNPVPAVPSSTHNPQVRWGMGVVLEAAGPGLTSTSPEEQRRSSVRVQLQAIRTGRVVRSVQRVKGADF